MTGSRLFLKRIQEGQEVKSLLNYAFRCLQDAEVLVKLTEEVNGRLKNKVSPNTV